MKTETRVLSRRECLKLTAAGLVVGGWTRQAVADRAAQTVQPGIALQLYSVRDDCAQDFDAALEEVARMGFKAVEFAGYHSYANDPQGLRKRLDDLGLKVAGTHIGTGSLQRDALSKTVEFHQALTCKYLIVPGDQRFADPDKSRELADIFNEAAYQLKPHDMYTGYHNHTAEFNTDPATGKTYWELFADRTSADVVLQQDVGWTTTAGADPVAMIRKYPQRSKIIHCKPALVEGAAGRPFIGEDSVKWSEIFAACSEVGGTEWYTVEQETYPDGKTPMECVRLSLAGIRKILVR